MRITYIIYKGVYKQKKVRTYEYILLFFKSIYREVFDSYIYILYNIVIIIIIIIKEINHIYIWTMNPPHRFFLGNVYVLMRTYF